MASEPDTLPDDPQPTEVAPDEVVAEPAPRAVMPELEGLVAAAVGARENNDSTRFMDGQNREWFIGTANVQNRSHVLIQVRRGEAIREAYLSTTTFTAEAAQAAILDLDGALP